MKSIDKTLWFCRSLCVLAASSLILGPMAESEAAKHRGAGNTSVQQRYGASAAGRSTQSAAARSRSSQRFSSGGFSSTGQMHQSRGSYQGNRPTQGAYSTGSRGSSANRQTDRSETTRQTAQNRTSPDQRQVGTNREGDGSAGRQDNAGDRQENRSDTRGQGSENRSDQRGDRQEEVTERQGNRQDGRTDRTDTRQSEMTERFEGREDFYDDYWDNYHGHYNGHYHDYWHHDDDWWIFAAGLVIGASIATLPPRYETVYVSSTTYYYANGHYYTTAPSGGYVVAAPPTNVVVQQPPAQVVNVTVNEQNYGYSNGAYYQIQEPEAEGEEPTFKTVEAPVGAKVDYVPDGAESKTIDGVTYFVFNDTYYRPFYSGSEVVYIVAEKPDSAS